MENTIGLKEFRLNIEKYSKKAAKGETITVLKRAKPLFNISAVNDGVWEVVTDFTKIKKGGVDIDEVLARL